MKTNNRINLNMSFAEAISAVTENNIRAVTALLKVIKVTPEIDPNSALGPLTVLLDVDSMGIYGEDLVTLCHDICDDDPVKVCALFRAWQMGQLEGVTEARIKQSIAKKSGEFDHDQILKAVQKELPYFAVAYLKANPSLPVMNPVENNPHLCVRPKGVGVEVFAKRMFYLVWRHCPGPMGLGIMQDRPGATEDEVWSNILGHADYPGGGLGRCSDKSPYADYVFGRMIKFGIKFEGDTINLRDGKFDREYQSWSLSFPSNLALVEATARDLGCEWEDANATTEDRSVKLVKIYKLTV